MSLSSSTTIRRCFGGIATWSAATISPSRAFARTTCTIRAVRDLQSGQSRALREIRERLGTQVEDWAIKEDLASLKNLGRIATAGHARGARWFLAGHSEE